MDYSKSGDLQEKYCKIGTALLTVESKSGLYALIANRSPSELSSELAFISNEVLESYLEDLLDIAINNQTLFIEQNNKLNLYSVISILGILTAIFMGLKVVAKGEPLSTAIFIIFLTATPFVLVYFLIPKKPNRRLFFAKLISLELERRRGGDMNKTKLSTKLAGFISSSEEQLSGAN